MNDNGNITETLYAGNFMYRGGSFDFYFHPEGYVEKENNAYKYYYQYKDHLGNIRVTYDNSGSVSSPNASIVEEHNYYPFGLQHRGYNDANGTRGSDFANNYMFGGKELQDEAVGSNRLDYYDFGARNYDPALGRWMNLDPLAEQMRRHSPYNYAFDNPIYWIDPDGMAPTDTYIDARTGKVLGQDGASTDNLRVIRKQDWDYWKDEHGGTISTQATADLQADSKLVTVNESQIQSEVQSVADDTKSEGIENQAFLTLDVNTGEVAAQRGPDGDNSETTIETTKAGDDGAPRTDRGKMLIAQVHGHPETTESGMENIPGTSSDKDKPTAMSLGITVFAIDSYNGTAGGQYDVHSVNKSGTQTNFVGKTKGASTGTINFTQILTNLLKGGR